MIKFSKTKEEYGWLSNMSAFPVEYQGRKFRSAEALFQALRFENQEIIEEIYLQKSPMGAKFVAKTHKDEMVVEPASQQDISNMWMILNLKVEQNPSLKEKLLSTHEEIVEDCTKRSHGRNLVWGMALVNEKWIGQNILGKLWMYLREELRKQP